MLRFTSVRTQLWVTLLLASALTVHAFSAEPGEAKRQLDDPGVPKPLAPPIDDSIRQLMQDRDYGEALKAIDAAMVKEGVPLDYLTYLKGRALFLQGEHAKAAQVLRLLDASYPESPWGRRARFDAAQAYARQGDYREAEAVYRKEAEYLFGPDRRQQIADVYLEFADAAFAPEDSQTEPDYRKALEFYLAALEVAPKPDRRVEIEMRIARCHQELDDTGAAAEEYAKFIASYPDSDMVIDARFRLGQCQLAQDRPAEARRTWQDLLAAHADSDSPRIAEAAFRLAETWGIPKPASAAALDLGVAALRSFLERFPKHENAGKARLLMAESYMHQQRFAEAVESLQGFLDDKQFAGSDQIPNARDLLGQCYQLQEEYDDAIRVWRQFLVEHTADERWNTVQQEIIDTEYLRAADRYERKEFDKARDGFSKFLAQYPLDERCPGILLLFGEMAYREEKWTDAIAAWKRVVSKYPERYEAGDAQFRIAETLEKNLGKFEEALKAYREAKVGSKAADARQAAARLTAKRLTVVTERVFRTDEPARLQLSTRNIESVTVCVYPIDMETYFRKMHCAPGVEQLDIALIDPEQTIEFQVPQYEKYRESDSTIEIPFGDRAAGVMAVTVSSRRLEATTLVIRSDLDVIVKSSRDEMFVFAENMLTGKAWPGVRLLLSDGRRLLAEGVTAEDGVFHQAFGQLADAEDVSVFAAVGDHIASNSVGLSGLTVAQGLEDEGYLYTDRPAYRAGEEVHVRGWIRRVESDKYVADGGRKFVLEVFDVRDRMLRQKEVVLSRFGGFHDSFELPATSPQGQYRVTVRDDEKHTYSGAFLVHEYKPEPIRLVVDCPRRVFYRGETIEGTIRAEHYYGAPVVGKEIQYKLSDGEMHTATTDDEGLVRFSFPTREYSEQQTLVLWASLPEKNLDTTVDYFLAAQAYWIMLSTSRPLFLAGESFEVTAKTFTPEGKPVGQPLTLKVLERTEVGGKIGERLVETLELTTGEADGVGRVTVTVKEGGRYVLRVEGTDRFENPVSGRADVTISGDDDEIRLRILADRHTYKAGDRADIPLHWRGAPALALVTFQGAKILDYRLVELKTGRNNLPVDFDADLAPNFELAVALMTDGDRKADAKTAAKRFHEANSPFTVERDLVVKMKWKSAGGEKESVRPGDQLEVTLTTTDPQGKPVAAEVSLAMIEQSLLDRFQWLTPDVSAVFRGSRREPQMRTESSICFTYRPETVRINARLLSEQERIEITAEEAESRRLAAESDMYGGSSGLGGLGGVNIPAGGGMGGMGGFAAGGGGFGSGARVTPPPPPSDDPFASPVPSDNPFGSATASAGDPFGRPATPEAADPFGGIPVRMGPDSRLDLTIRQTEQVHDESPPVPQLSKAQPEPTGKSQSLAYWNPTILTNENGQATASIAVPQQSTAWCLLAKGITVDTLVGETEESLVVKKDLFGQMRLPPAFTDGDLAEIPISVYHEALNSGPVEVILKTTVGGRSVEDSQKIDVDKKGITKVAFRREFRIPGHDDLGKEVPSGAGSQIEFELSVKSGDYVDRVSRTLPLLPYGATIVVRCGGSATGDTSTWIEPPKSMPPASPSLQITVGPTVQRSLLDTVLGPPTSIGLDPFVYGSPAESSASDLMAGLALQDLLVKTEASDRPEMLELDRRIRSAIASLIASQRDDGAWSWTGGGNTADRNTTAYVVWSLSLARTAGFRVPDDGYNKAVQYLQNSITTTDNADHAGKALLLHAATVAGRADFNLANRLYRLRETLSTAALLHLALTFAAMDRGETATELLKLAAERKLDGDAGQSVDGAYALVELRSLHALALQQVAPASPEAKASVDWLLANRSGTRWSPDRATGPAVAALCRWFGTNRFETEKYRLDVFAGDTKVRTLDVDAASPSQVVDVPASLVANGRQQIRFQMTGRGRYTYQCTLSGFVPAEKLSSTTQAWIARRIYEPAPLEVDGKEIARGFSILEGSYKSFRNPATQLPVGRRAIVLLGLQRRSATTPAAGPPEYLIVHESIPSGTEVVAGSVTGPFEHHEITPGGITFYVGDRRQLGTIRYELRGSVAGQYRAAPTIIRNAYRPEQMVAVDAVQLAVIPAGQKSTDAYRLTPQELFGLGQRCYEKGQFEQAAKHLGELVSNWTLRQATYQNVVRMLLDIHLELGPPEQIVRYFEILTERWPDEEISFEKALKIGAAYEQMGEFERSYLAFRGTVEGRFMRETGVAGFLETQDEFLRSMDFMERLLQEYPSEGYAATAAYSLAQRVYTKASEAAASERLRAAKITRIDLVRRAAGMLDDFLTVFPEDPAADQAAFARANALLELEAYDGAIAACNRYSGRYPQSDLLDSFWYLIGYCHFAAGRPEAAIEMCRKVSEATRLDKSTGRQVEARNKWLAIFILGQIYHSLGQPQQAIEQYRRVEDRFGDAKASIEDFLRKDIKLPELTTAVPGSPVELELQFRNIASCDVKVYRIDLMKFGLLQKDLGGISQINLAGVRPRHDEHLQLGDGLDYADRTRKLALPLQDEGAYLVVCRGDDLHTSGLVILTPLTLEVHQDLQSGQVRTTVKNTAENRNERDVHVKVIGSRNQDFVSGSTDLRGVFVADGIHGSATVIAHVEPSRYALHRGAATAAAAEPAAAVEGPVSLVVPGEVTVGTSAAEDRIRAALRSLTAVDFVDTPLSEAADSLGRAHGITIRLDTRALEDVSLETDTPVSASLRGVSLKSALRLILEQLDLTYVIRDEVLMITTPEEAQEQQVTRLYPVSDLITYKTPSGEKWADYDTLITTLSSTIQPDTWEDVGGPGSMAPLSYGGTEVIAIRQTDEVHEEIAAMLAKMRGLAEPRDDGEVPVRERPEMYGGVGGMQGMGGGMGGMGGGGMGAAGGFSAGGGPRGSAGEKTDLLEGLQDTNRELQGEQMKKLDKMYKEGSGMGGMGSGFF